MLPVLDIRSFGIWFDNSKLKREIPKNIKKDVYRKIPIIYKSIIFIPHLLHHIF